MGSSMEDESSRDQTIGESISPNNNNNNNDDNSNPHHHNNANNNDDGPVTHPTKTLHIAPMLHVSNYEFRNFFRILTKHATLWTEMVVDETVAFNAHDKYQLTPHLHKDPIENPVVCQIGGIDAAYTATASKLVVQYFYQGINLNMDCPSDRVSGRNFGAILMKQIDQAAAILKCMQDNTPGDFPVSVKCRVGIDDLDSYEFLEEMITQLYPVCKRFVLHARKCVLKGLSPKENRLVPPLNYPRVYAICDRFPDCEFLINGGIPSLKAAKRILYGNGTTQSLPTNITNHPQMSTSTSTPENNQGQHQVPCMVCNVPNGSCTAPPQRVPPNLLGCMLGRAAMDHPAQFWDVDRYFYGCRDNPCQNRRQVLDQYIAFLERVFPRRCCDSDERVTSRLPSPDNLVFERPYCPICREFAEDQNTTIDLECIPTLKATYDSRKGKNKKTSIKIYQGIVDRCLRPTHGIFFGLKGCRQFRRACDKNCRDPIMRNCGPAFLLRKALQTMPEEVLDQPFVRTEDVKDSDIPVHVSPQTCSACLS